MLTIDPAVAALYPQARMGILAMANLSPGVPADPYMAEDALLEIRRRYGHLDRAALKALQPIAAYATYYRSFGYSYHVLAQLESVLKGKKQLLAESLLLQAMFTTEIESMLLTAGHDLEQLQPPLVLKLTAGTESYPSISGSDITTVQNDMMVVSGSHVISSILRGPDRDSRITPATTRALFTLYAPPGVEEHLLQAALETLERRIRAGSPNAQTLQLQVYTAG